MRKFGLLAVAAMTLGLTATAVLPSTETTNAQASSIKVVWRKAMGSHTYQINTSKAKNAYAFSSSFKHVFKLSNYSGTVFYTKQHEKIKVNGKYSYYYYVQSADKKKAGWINRTYLNSVKIMSSSALSTAIKNGTDLDPSSTILSQNSAFYNAYKSTLEKNFNLMSTSLTHFSSKGQARVYVESSAMKTYAQNAMNTWNKALGKQVFVAGTAKSHDIVMATKTSGEWDGLYDGAHIYLSTNYLNDPSYMQSVADTPEIRSLYDQYETVKSEYKAETNATKKQEYYNEGTKLHNALIAAQKKAAPSATDYWSGVLTHELGHALGLDHTPYLTDIMYAETSDDGFSSAVDGKYAWNGPKDPNDNRLESASLSQRDVDRAKLAGKVGLW
ncbi:matrixin family metalloprotease [Secundilactobacillus paracollinoides]|uniref:Peptidase M10 metallopeptidase domain-containing protein n=1 Tax=Secundilactobacillus paracollinoides TaxID=240427 RepID=A0A1B2IVE3_9LACO|nr:matrixin family metalloprotease [Secundilactobacillus paracollinoides]ANZ60195.1 hypothetical protein AYR61_01730 [Secundilactobacillus paracollinoides]ANZ65989.1 hypothetical protein AYR63_01750 [Secundilactobacillus paracollinoides]